MRLPQHCLPPCPLWVVSTVVYCEKCCTKHEPTDIFHDHGWLPLFLLEYPEYRCFWGNSIFNILGDWCATFLLHCLEIAWVGKKIPWRSSGGCLESVSLINLEMRILHTGTCLGIFLEGKDVCGKTREQEAAEGWFEERCGGKGLTWTWRLSCKGSEEHRPTLSCHWCWLQDTSYLQERWFPERSLLGAFSH